MKLIANHKKLIAWYQKKLGLSDYGLLWLVFFKGVFVALLLERFIAHQIFNIYIRFENLSTPKVINKINPGFILFCDINLIFKTFIVRSTDGMQKKERKRLKKGYDC